MELISLHLFTLALTALVVLYADHEGFSYFLGKKQLLSESFLKWSHRLVWLGLLSMIVTGVLLTIPAWEYRLQEPAFYVKMGFVGVLCVNAFAIGSLSRVAAVTPFVQLTKEEKQTLLLSGFLSSVSWVGAAAIGFTVL
jgi:hypothetical protein